VLELARALGFERFHLVGHDWGAGAGWAALAVRPDPVRSRTALSLPRYLAFARALRDDPDEEFYRGILKMLLAADGSTQAAFAAMTSRPSEPYEFTARPRRSRTT
jgi:pimeloyl-ACP methyl ester carboxylesterase